MWKAVGTQEVTRNKHSSSAIQLFWLMRVGGRAPTLQAPVRSCTMNRCSFHKDLSTSSTDDIFQYSRLTPHCSFGGWTRRTGLTHHLENSAAAIFLESNR